MGIRLKRLVSILGRPLCVLTIHQAEVLWVTGGKMVQSLRGPFGRVYHEGYICARCRVMFFKRVRSRPAVKQGRRSAIGKGRAR